MASFVNEDKAAEMLAAGIQGSVVASTLGCDPSYISQLLGRSDFKEKVSALKVARASAGMALDKIYDDTELIAAKQLERMIPLIMKPQELLRAVEVLNKLKRRTAVDAVASNPGTRIVNVILPPVVMTHFQVSANNEVVQVGDNSMLTLPSQQFRQKVKDGSLLQKEITHVTVEGEANGP